jgi:hypothetical protein
MLSYKEATNVSLCFPLKFPVFIVMSKQLRRVDQIKGVAHFREVQSPPIYMLPKYISVKLHRQSTLFLGLRQHSTGSILPPKKLLEQQGSNSYD